MFLILINQTLMLGNTTSWKTSSLFKRLLWRWLTITTISFWLAASFHLCTLFILTVSQ